MPSLLKPFIPFFISILIIGAPIRSALGDDTAVALQDFVKRVKKITLKNGLRVILVERPSSPTISFSVYIRTGGIDDPAGQSGMAHMFEHMLFKGSKTLGTKNYQKEKPLLLKLDKAAQALQDELDKGVAAEEEKVKQLIENLKALQKEHESLIVSEEFWKIYEKEGGRGLNAGTGFDYTNYVISLPKNRLKLWMAMESDRIRNPVLREFYKERDVVLEERRLRVDNSPRGRLWEAFLGTAFMAHNYGRPIIGWEAEIGRLTRAQSDSFFNDYYDVSRLVFVIVGGIDAKKTEAMLKKYFESIPSNPSKKKFWLTPEPPQEGERRVDVLYKAEPSVLIGWHRPNFDHPDNAALEVLSDILSSGRTSRFNKNIVQDQQIATSVWSGGSTPGDREPNLFVVGGTPRAPHTTIDLELAVYEEIQRIKAEGPSEKELQKVKNFAIEYVLRQLSSNSGLSSLLGYYEALAGDWQFLFDFVDDIQNVSADDVKRVARTYLRQSNRTVATLVRKR